MCTVQEASACDHPVIMDIIARCQLLNKKKKKKKKKATYQKYFTWHTRVNVTTHVNFKKLKTRANLLFFLIPLVDFATCAIAMLTYGSDH